MTIENVFIILVFMTYDSISKFNIYYEGIVMKEGIRIIFGQLCMHVQFIVKMYSIINWFELYLQNSYHHPTKEQARHAASYSEKKV